MITTTCWAVCCGLLGACSPGSVPPGPPPATSPAGSSAPVESLPDWSRVSLPGDFTPASLADDGQALWIGGVALGNRQPRLARAAAAGTANRGLPQLVPLRPVSPHARDAEIASLAVDRGRVAALGAVRAGAHANVRWTVWQGSERGLQEQPQSFNTFGGPDAGDLVGIVGPSSGPVIMGTWSGPHGLDGAAWLPVGHRWIRQHSAGTVLASTARDQVSPRGVSSSADRVVAVGSVLELGTDLRQRPAVWTWPAPAARWSRGLLPSPGRRSEVLAAACEQAGCDVFGHVDDRLAGWRVGDATPRRLPDLPSTGLQTNPGASAFTVRTASGVRVGLAFSGDRGEGRLLLATAAGWRLFATPAGIPGRAAVVGTRIYLVLQQGDQRALWSTDLAAIVG